MKKEIKLLVVLAVCAMPGLASATNGMNMEGYGPVALGMGGAAMAYDNGTAAMMNNPATLGLMPDSHRLDLALGFLGPDVNAAMGGMSSHSSADAFGGPAFGWSRRHDKFTFGVGVFGQGGMGAEYGGNSFMSMGTGLTTRSELGVGRLLFPLAYNVTPDLTVGGTFDFVWAGLDLQMAMRMDQMAPMMAPGGGSFGAISGSLAGALGGMGLAGSDVGYFNFSNSNPYSGRAHATGYAGKLGFVYKVSPALSVGGTYHSETALDDLEANGAEMRIVRPGMGDLGAPMSGKLTVKNFQWPETIGAGLAYQAHPRLMVVADYKRINWARAMRDFRMSFVDGASGANLDVTLYQNWKDQDVWMAGLSYQSNDALTLRAGVNLANNPVPDYYMHPLFPATIRNHVTAGLGYRFSKTSSLDFAYSYAPEVSVTNGSGVGISHSQNNMQFIYSHVY